MTPGHLEVRAAASLSLPSPGRLAGYAAVFDSPADMGPFMEVLRQGTFSRSLQQPGRIVALYDHERRSILGRVSAGTLRLKEDFKGLAFEVDLPDTSIGRDLAVLVQRGDVTGASFGFITPSGGDRWQRRDDKPLRELLSVDLHEITITSAPAYADTSVALRSLPHAGACAPTDIRRLWLETV